jgi:hypothetical protein
MQHLDSQAARAHGLWRKACALGISDIDLLYFFEVAWGWGGKEEGKKDRLT